MTCIKTKVNKIDDLTKINISARLYSGPSGLEEKAEDLFPLQPRNVGYPEVFRGIRLKYLLPVGSESTFPYWLSGKNL